MGRGMAERFSSEGANVVLCDVHEDKLTEVAKTLPQERTLALRCDVTDFDAVQQLVAAAGERFGGATGPTGGQIRRTGQGSR